MQRRRREAGAVYAECRSGHVRFGAPRPAFCFGVAQFAKRALGYAELIGNLNISFCRIRFRKSKISPRMKATADIQIIEVAAPRDSL